MKNQFLTILIWIPFALFGQKTDYVWYLGYASNPNNPDFGGTIVDFNTTPPRINYQYRAMNFRSNALTVSDGNGQCVFYTNGIYIADSSNQPMLGWDTLSPGLGTTLQAASGLMTPQGVVSLPDPSDPNRFYLFHVNYEQTNVGGPLGIVTVPRNVYYSIVDKTGNNGLGEIVEINTPILSDTLNEGRLSACRHANGRDWWIIAPFVHGTHYNKLFLDTSGVHNAGTQYIGSSYPYPTGGQAVFSPDGTKYVVYGATGGGLDNYLDIYDFDRCTGQLSNYVGTSFNDSSGCGGVAISSNSRYIYACSHRRVYQYDLRAPDIIASRRTVAEWDGYLVLGHIFASFFLAQIAPDGKIYISSNTGVPTLHIIHNPNLPGLACNVEQRGLVLATFNSFSMPNFPNYRLGPIDGSSCDTLGIDVLYPALLASPAPVDFGAVGIGLDSTRRLWLHNTGQADLYIDSLVSQDAHFTYLPQNVLVHPGDSLGVDVTFTPTQVQYYEDTLWVYSTAPGGRQGVVLMGGELPNDVLQPSIHTNNGHQASFSVYPSPVGTWLSIQYEYLPEGAAFQLFDVMGRLAFAGSLSAGMGKAQINVSFLSAGLYCLRLSADGVLVGNVLVVKE